MDEAQLIDIMSYLDPELLDNEYIENDLSRFSNIVKGISGDIDRPISIGFKITIFILAGAAVAAGAVGLIAKKKKKTNFSKKNVNFPGKVLKLVTN